MKTCAGCRTAKPREAFNRRAASVDGLQRVCRDCDRERVAAWRVANRAHLRQQARRRRGVYIAPSEEAALHARQGGACAICGAQEADLPQGLHLDHDHQTGAIRGLLCRKCNTALGLLGDTADSVRAALDYLEKSAQ